MTASITIESAREAAAPLLRSERDGWVDLPCGGSVLIESGRPTWFTDAGSEHLQIQDVLGEAADVLGSPVAATHSGWSRDVSDGIVRAERVGKVA